MALISPQESAEARVPAGPLERRESPRYACRLEAFCQPTSGHQDLSWLAVIVSLSTTGLMLESTRLFEPSTFLSVALENQSPHAPAQFAARVAHTRPMPAGPGWMIGCTFVRKLSNQELQALLSS